MGHEQVGLVIGMEVHGHKVARGVHAGKEAAGDHVQAMLEHGSALLGDGANAGKAALRAQDEADAV